MLHDRAIRRIIAVGVAGMLLASSLPAAAEEFSADIASTNATAPSAAWLGQLHVENDKVRFEKSDMPDGFFVSDTAAPAAFFVKPAPKVFMDANQTTQLTQLLVPIDPNDPCRQWQTMAVLTGAADKGGQWVCERVGEETIDGRKATVYRATSPTNRQNSAWIDPQLKFVLRIRTDDGTTIELRNIQKGPQVASLFEIPSNYRKFDPKLLIERIKQSDVWVEPQH